MTSRISVLVFDDEPEMAEFVTNAADILGYEAKYVTNPADFSSAFSRDIDIIILDLFMPELDGIEVLRFLHDNRSEASVIFMSGKDTSILHSAKEIAQQRGIKVLGILQKPFKIDELEEVLSAFEHRKTNRSSVGGSSPRITEKDLSEAIEREQLHIVYQPQVSFITAKMVGFEGLARWTHPELGAISPGEFIPIAEASGLIQPLTQLVINNGIRQAAIWHEAGLDLTLSLNVSPTTMIDLDLPERLSAISNRYSVPTEKIIIEVTETAVMADAAVSMDILTRLRMKGFGLSIDDFGTGYSSLYQLVRLPFTELKIDQAFVKPMMNDKECRTVVQTAIGLAHQMAMKVVAEGVESRDVAFALRELGCDIAQGFYFSKPLAPGDVSLNLSFEEYFAA